MHRPGRTTRVSEDFVVQSASYGLRASSDGGELPMYDPFSDLAKKERLRIRIAENAVHVIPAVLVLCAIILWFFSNPGHLEKLQMFPSDFNSRLALQSGSQSNISFCML